MNVDRGPIKLNVDVQNQDDEEINTTSQNLHGNHKYWKVASGSTHQPRQFLTYLEHIRLTDDTITSLRQFYERICLAFHSSFSTTITVLPLFHDLSIQKSFKTYLVPTNENYAGYHSIYETYTWFGTALYTLLTDIKMISSKTAPLTARIINHDKTTLDG